MVNRGYSWNRVIRTPIIRKILCISNEFWDTLRIRIAWVQLYFFPKHPVFRYTFICIYYVITPQISILKSISAIDKPYDGVLQFRTTTLESVKVNINKHARQIEELSEKIVLEATKYPNSKEKLNSLVAEPSRKLEEVRKLHAEKCWRLNEEKLEFTDVYEELLDKTKLLVSL